MDLVFFFPVIFIYCNTKCMLTRTLKDAILPQRVYKQLADKERTNGGKKEWMTSLQVLHVDYSALV